MKRYLLFTYDYYEAGGAEHDAQGSYDTLEDAKSAWLGETFPCAEAQVLDMQNRIWGEKWIRDREQEPPRPPEPVLPIIYTITERDTP